jgi:hypothetical protein
VLRDMGSLPSGQVAQQIVSAMTASRYDVE